MREEQRRLTEVEKVKSELEPLLEEYNEFELEIADLKQIQYMIDMGPVHRLGAQINDYKGQPLKYFSKPGLDAVYNSIKVKLDELPIAPDRTFLVSDFSEIETVILADWEPPFLLKCKSIQQYLDMLINFQKYLSSEIEFCDAELDLGIFYDDPILESERSLKFKELFLD